VITAESLDVSKPGLLVALTVVTMVEKKDKKLVELMVEQRGH
jgi:hypothetical protein